MEEIELSGDVSIEDNISVGEAEIEKDIQNEVDILRPEEDKACNEILNNEEISTEEQRPKYKREDVVQRVIPTKKKVKNKVEAANKSSTQKALDNERRNSVRRNNLEKIMLLENDFNYKQQKRILPPIDRPSTAFDGTPYLAKPSKIKNKKDKMVDDYMETLEKRIELLKKQKEEVDGQTTIKDKNKKSSRKLDIYDDELEYLSNSERSISSSLVKHYKQNISSNKSNYEKINSNVNKKRSRKILLEKIKISEERKKKENKQIEKDEIEMERRKKIINDLQMKGDHLNNILIKEILSIQKANEFTTTNNEYNRNSYLPKTVILLLI